MEVKPTTLENIKLLFNSPDEVYPMTTPRGRVLIIHNDEFDEAVNDGQANLDYRIGAETDLEQLGLMFKALDFIVIPHSDVSSEHMLEIIKQETKHPDHAKYGMFIMVILSHGGDGVLYGSDSRKVSIRDITRRLFRKNFPSMANKPKMVIIQACAGNEDDGVVHDDSAGYETGVLAKRSGQAIPSVSDFIILQASYPGFKSYRHSHSGTFMIQAFINVMKEYSCQDNVHEIVMKVRNKVLEMCEEVADENKGGQTVYSSETLRKKLYFFPGISGLELTESTSTCTLPEPSPSSQIPLSKATEDLSSNRGPAQGSTKASTSSRQATLPPCLPSGRSSVSLSPPPAVSTSAASSASTSSVKLTSLVKLRHLETISTPDYCFTVTLGPDSQVIHGGMRYDSLNGKRGGLSINCIRAAQDNQLIMLEKGYITDTTHIVTYQLNQEPALMQKLFSLTPNTAYRETNKIQVQYNACITQFTKIDDLLIQTGGDSGKLYFYRYPTGGLIREVTHPDMKRPRGICHDANSDIYVTDPVSNSIFNVTLNNDGSPTVTKLSCEIVRPTGITSRDGLLAVLSTVQPVPELHIITTRGETVTVIELPKCRCSNVLDFSINTRGVVAIANVGNGVQLYELE